MIRRELTSAGQGPTWLLVSQVEHARLSAVLAGHCRLTLNTGGNGQLVPSADLRREMLDAIERHDDGWTQWEAAPALYGAHGRPLSFQEVPAEEAVEIWTRSIESAERSGPLAASMVAGHFMRLAAHSDWPEAHPQVVRWKSQVEFERDSWLRTWTEQDPARRTRAAAEQAVDWLQLFDILSLWLCYAWPMSGRSSVEDPDDPDHAESWASVGRQLPLPTEFTELCPSARQAGPKQIDEHNGVYRAEASILPWRFDCPVVEVFADALLLPVRRYAKSDPWKSFATSRRLQWRLSRLEVIPESS